MHIYVRFSQSYNTTQTTHCLAKKKSDFPEKREKNNNAEAKIVPIITIDLMRGCNYN